MPPRSASRSCQRGVPGRLAWPCPHWRAWAQCCPDATRPCAPSSQCWLPTSPPAQFQTPPLFPPPLCHSISQLPSTIASLPALNQGTSRKCSACKNAHMQGGIDTMSSGIWALAPWRLGQRPRCRAGRPWRARRWRRRRVGRARAACRAPGRRAAWGGPPRPSQRCAPCLAASPASCPGSSTSPAGAHNTCHLSTSACTPSHDPFAAPTHKHNTARLA